MLYDITLPESSTFFHVTCDHVTVLQWCHINPNPKSLKNKHNRKEIESICHMQVHLSGNNVPAVKPPSNHTSPPSTAATFLATRFMTVLQPSRYSVFHGRDTPIQLSLP